MAVNLKPPSYFSKPKQNDVEPDGKKPELLPPSLFQKPMQQPEKQNKLEVCCVPFKPCVKSSNSTIEKVKEITAQEASDPEPCNLEMSHSERKISELSHIHFKELSEATKAIIELNIENVRLLRSKADKETRSRSEEESRMKILAYPDPQQIAIYQDPRAVDYHHSQLLPIQHTTELITKQASEIGQLKAEIHELKSKHLEQLQALQDQLKHHERDNVTKCAELESKLKFNEEGYRREVEQLRNVTEQKQFQLEETIERKSMELQHNKATIQTLLESKEDQQRKLESIDLQTRALVRDKEEEIVQRKQQVTQLRTYIHDSLPSTKTATTWEVDQQNLKRKIKSLEKECSSLKTNLDLTNLRLTSANEIQAIQELELSKALPNNMTKTEHLLTKWRKNVFSLMVQRKSQDVTMTRDDINHKQQVNDLKRTLESLQNEKGIMSHTIQDREAQLQIQFNTNQGLEEELVSVQEIAGILDQRLQDTTQACLKLGNLVKRHELDVGVMETSMKNALLKLTSYHQRIDFALSRITILKGLLHRKDTMWKVQLNKMTPDKETSVVTVDTTSSTDIVCTSDDKARLNKELLQVILERDMLAEHLKKDSLLVQQHIESANITYENTIQEKQDRILELNTLLAATKKKKVPTATLR